MNGENAIAFQAVPDTAECVVEFLGNTVVSKNVFHAEKPGGYDLADLTILAGVVDTAVGAAWLGQMSQDVSYIQTLVRGLAFENDQEVTSNSSAGPGSIVGGVLPGNVTYAVKKSSGKTGRSARGRLYWIGLTVNQLGPNENLLTQAASDDIVANVESMRGSIAASIWNAVIVSRFQDNVKRPFGVTFPWIGSSAVDLEVDSMRPRLL